MKKCKCSTKRLAFGHDEKRPMLGKYVVSGGKIRDKKIIHVRVILISVLISLFIAFPLSYMQRLSNTIMVRVGGGWVTLDHFLLDYDPCRIEELK